MKKILFLLDSENNYCYIKYLDKQARSLSSAHIFIEHLCLIHGKSIKGCLSSSQYFLGNIKKNPIYIDRDTCFFVVKINRGQSCLWLNAMMIDHVERISDHLSLIFFCDDHQMIIDISMRSLKKQLDRSFILEKMICE